MVAYSVTRGLHETGVMQKRYILRDLVYTRSTSIAVLKVNQILLSTVLLYLKKNIGCVWELILF